jgi:hypothetical protein
MVHVAHLWFAQGVMSCFSLLNSQSFLAFQMYHILDCSMSSSADGGKRRATVSCTSYSGFRSDLRGGSRVNQIALAKSHHIKKEILVSFK